MTKQTHASWCACRNFARRAPHPLHTFLRIADTPPSLYSLMCMQHFRLRVFPILRWREVVATCGTPVQEHGYHGTSAACAMRLWFHISNLFLHRRSDSLKYLTAYTNEQALQFPYTQHKQWITLTFMFARGWTRKLALR